MSACDTASFLIEGGKLANILQSFTNGEFLCAEGDAVHLIMDLESLQKLCTSFPHVVEDIKWENHLCFNIGGKMFLVTSPDQVPVTASFKCSDEEFEAVSSRPGFQPAPYMARHKWVYVNDIGLLSGSEWKHFARQAYDLVKAKLPKKAQRAMGD
jgi:predicted DNA-binding protein (MmcQ/YjbR family)